MNCVNYTDWSYAVCVCVNRKKPFSLVRMGDGEWAVIKWPKYTTDEEVKKQFNKWFPPQTYTMRDVEIIREGILQACNNADILGIPSIYEQRAYPKWKDFDKLMCEYGLDNKRVTIHFYEIDKLWKDGKFDIILNGREYLGIITSRDVTAKLKRRYLIDNIEKIEIAPERFKWHANNAGLDAVNAASNTALHWPKIYYEIKARFTNADEKGKLWLVGAGGLGKIYCDMIRNAHGIAIDIGALFDGWAGLITRPYLQDINKYAI